METKTPMSTFSVALFLLAGMLGSSAPGMLIADYGPPLAIRIIFAALPYTVFPFALGWLVPARWWMAGVAALGTLFIAVVSLLTAPPRALEELWARLPIFLPLLLTFSCAYLGRNLRIKQLRKMV